MRSFTLEHPRTTKEAVRSALDGVPAAAPFLAGGTTLLDLMKLDVMRPDRLVALSRIEHGSQHRIVVSDAGLRLGAMVTMADAAEHPVFRSNYPVIAQSLALAASQQLREMATIGGNVLQRTRCSYYRDPSFACNRRDPGSGCPAIAGVNRGHAVLGTSEHCIATYAGDFAQALVALDAVAEVEGLDGTRRFAFADLHRLPGATPHLEHDLRPGELITAFHVPAGPWTARSTYLKIRDRASHAFALISAAVALHVEDGIASEARIGLGGVATVPWRARHAEAALRGQPADAAVIRRAAAAELAGARLRSRNRVKSALLEETLVRAVLQLSAMDVRS